MERAPTSAGRAGGEKHHSADGERRPSVRPSVPPRADGVHSPFSREASSTTSSSCRISKIFQISGRRAIFYPSLAK